MGGAFVPPAAWIGSVTPRRPIRVVDTPLRYELPI